MIGLLVHLALRGLVNALDAGVTIAFMAIAQLLCLLLPSTTEVETWG